MNILALDLGKFNTTCCFFNSKTRKARFLTTFIERETLAAVFQKNKVDLVVMEACGPSGWINDLAKSTGLTTLVCSTNEEAWRWANVKRKTDKDDALKLDRMAAMRELKAVHTPSQEHRQFRSLVKYRKTLDGRIDDPHRFENGRQVSAYFGLVPRQYQSGETDRNGRITKRGNPLARTILVECAWASLRYNPWAKGVYERIYGKQKTRKKKAAVALARKIAVIGWAMLRDERDWDPNAMIKTTKSFRGKLPMDEAEFQAMRPRRIRTIARAAFARKPERHNCSRRLQSQLDRARQRRPHK